MTEERREGHSRLTWDKDEQRIKAIDPHEDEHARTVKTIHGNAAMLASMLRSAETERDLLRAEIERLRADKQRLDYLEGEWAAENAWRDSGRLSSRPLSLFRRNVPISRETIDAAMSEAREARP